MESLFATFNNPQAVNFNKDLNNWDVSKVTTMKYMFTSATAFNQPMNNWDVSKVTNMQGMFNNVAAYNQPLKDWDLSNVKYMDYMFNGAKAYNQDLCDWGKVASFPYSFATDMFVGSGCTYKAEPIQATKGPFCADDCTAVFV
jgi:surface protein